MHSTRIQPILRMGVLNELSLHLSAQGLAHRLNHIWCFPKIKMLKPQSRQVGSQDKMSPILACIYVADIGVEHKRSLVAYGPF